MLKITRYIHPHTPIHTHTPTHRYMIHLFSQRKTFLINSSFFQTFLIGHLLLHAHLQLAYCIQLSRLKYTIKYSFIFNSFGIDFCWEVKERESIAFSPHNLYLKSKFKYELYIQIAYCICIIRNNSFCVYSIQAHFQMIYVWMQYFCVHL